MREEIYTKLLDSSHVWCKECSTQVLLLCSCYHNSEKLPHRSTMVNFCPKKSEIKKGTLILFQTVEIF